MQINIFINVTKEILNLPRIFYVFLHIQLNESVKKEKKKKSYSKSSNEKKYLRISNLHEF